MTSPARLRRSEVPADPIRELLLPHRFSLWLSSIERVNASNLALKDRTFVSYPFPIPLSHMVQEEHVMIEDVHMAARLPQLRFHELHQQLIHTDPRSRTVIAPSVENLDHYGSQLHSVRVSNELWTALVGFALGPGPIPQPVGQNTQLPGIPGTHFSTFRDGAPLMPTRYDQLRPITSLWGWFLSHLTTGRRLVNSELAVQDEVYRQLLYPMDLLMLVMHTRLS